MLFNSFSGLKVKTGISVWLITLLAMLMLLSLSACDDDESDSDDNGGASDDDVADDDDTSEPGQATLVIGHEPVSMTDSALQAVDAVPDWLQDDLAISLAQLEPEIQDELAALVLDEDPIIVDEIAFTIAHTSPEVLDHPSFHSELLLLNAQLIYEHDKELDYVELVEVGTPGDPDYYTTTKYIYESDDKGLAEETVDREMYYWYVVHPRLEDELPYFINGWESSRATTPEEGYFWREFIWERAAEECPYDRECPLLKDALAGVEVVRRKSEDSAYDTDANRQVWNGFVKVAVAWGAGIERPIQPVRIYTVGRGNCGEWADMYVAAGRTALIPIHNVGARANDHTWGEWWSTQWWGEYGKYANKVRRNLMDNNCDGLADDGLDEEDHDQDGVSVADGDCNDDNIDIFPGATEVQNGWDDNCDGFADEGFVDAQFDGDGDGFTIETGDCADLNADIYPGSLEGANGIDENCDGTADDGADQSDFDQDTYTIAAGDCNDFDGDINPGATEQTNGKDDDCNGVADDGADDSDADGDYHSIADGDCNDTDGTVYPGADELVNGRDDNCNGVVDENTADADFDGDTFSIAQGDCNDNDDTRYPGATELGNGVDDNCDGVADEGLTASDRDGDGYTMADGDCYDLSADFSPEAMDPYTGAVLYAITASRGDSFLDLDRTVDYGTLQSYLEFEVTDKNGLPVDGAVISIYGPWLVYNEPDLWGWAGEVVTDINGYALAVVGEYGDYGYSVSSPIGDYPGANSLKVAVEYIFPGETFTVQVKLRNENPNWPEVTQEDLTGGAAAHFTLKADFQVENHRQAGDGNLMGTFSLFKEGGVLDAFVLDSDNYDKYKKGEAFKSQVVKLETSDGNLSVDLPQDRTWHLVLSNPGTLAGTMVGIINIEATPSGDTDWPENPLTLDYRFRIPPAEHLSVEIRP